MSGPGTILRKRQEGIAFVLVLAVLMALMVLAGPFLLTATNESAASAQELARARARIMARSTAAYAVQRLVRGHAALEALAGHDPATPFASPRVDLAGELNLSPFLLDKDGHPYRDPEGIPLMHHADPRDVIVDLKVRDAHSFPSLLTAPPLLIASVLGRATLAKDITDSDTEIPVSDGSHFPARNGILNVEGELISYKERSGDTFLGCQRGHEGGLKQRRHQEEAWVFDDRARLIAMLPFKSPRARGGYREPLRGTYIKEIALLGEQALSPLEVDRLLRRFSVMGMRFQADRFGPGTRVRRDLDPEQGGQDGFRVQAVSNEGFTPGTVVRISDGVQTEYGMVARSRGGFGFATLTLYEPPQHTFLADRTEIAPLLRQPLNINACDKETLVAVLTGLQVGFGGFAQGSKLAQVDEDAAETFAEGIIEARPITGFQKLRDVLEDLISAHRLTLNGLQAVSIFRNAVNPNDRRLQVSSVPFSFASYDFYRIEAAVAVNDGSGRELARLRLRERVRVAPLGILTRSLNTQQEFEEPIIRTHSARWTTTHPLPTARWSGDTTIPADRVPRMLYRFMMGKGLLGGDASEREQRGNDPSLARQSGQHGLFPDPDEGDVRLLPARMESFGYNQHFDGPSFQTRDDSVPLEDIDPEGYKTERGPFEISPRDRRGSQGFPTILTGRGGRNLSGGASGSLVRRINPNPVRVDMWYYTGSNPRSGTRIFDLVGRDPEEDRISLRIDGDGTLRGRVSGRTLDDPGDAFEEVAETSWMPESGAGFWDANTWYHLGLAYRGTRPGDVSLIVDGFMRGHSRYATTLAGSFKMDDATFNVVEADDWPVRGVALVGSEVVSFRRSGTTFEVQSLGTNELWGRGRRGTRRRAHGAGTPVTLFGYSALPRRAATLRGGVVIPAGSGSLSAGLGRMTLAAFAENDSLSVQIPTGGGNTRTATIKVHDPQKSRGDMLELDPASLEGDPEAFPEAGGYILIVSAGFVLPGGASLPTGVPNGGVELAFYTRRSGNRLLGVTSPLTIPNPKLAAQAAGGLPGAGGGGPGGQQPLTIQTQRMIHMVSVQGGGVNLPHLACVFPISIAVSNADGYAKPQAIQGGASDWDTYPEFVQVGTPDLRDLDNHDVEWIRYHHVDPSGHLLMDELPYLRFAANRCLATLRNGNLPAVAVALNHNFGFPMRRQGGTDVLSEGRHSRGELVLPCFRTVSFTRREAINVPIHQGEGLEAPTRGEPWSPCGWGDAVTIEEPNARSRRLAHVSWAGRDSLGEPGRGTPGSSGGGSALPIPPAYDGHGWVALTESLGRSYRQSRSLPASGEVPFRTRYLRLLKFPSGELPDIGRGARAFAGGDADGRTAAADGRVDELRVTPFVSADYVVWDHDAMDFANNEDSPAKGVSAQDDEIPVAAVQWMVSNPPSSGGNPRYYILPDGRRIFYKQDLTTALPRKQPLPENDAGLVRIDDEIIAFRGVGTGQSGAPALLNCVRGFMDTTPQAHGYGAQVVVFDFQAITMLQDALETNSRSLQVADTAGLRSTGGTLLIDQEMLHYTEAQGNTLSMPASLDAEGEEEGGLFRGRFGTTAAAHDADSIVLAMPFRYWDRYVERQDSPELSWYGFSLDLKGAFFHKLRFDAYSPGESANILVLCRTRGDISWAADPASTPGLFRFDASSETEPDLIDLTGDRLDVRVYWRYLQGAFNASTMDQHDWKRTPELRSISVDYLDASRVLEQEESQ